MKKRFWESPDKIKLKICGVDSIGFAMDCYDLGVDALGFHLWKHEFDSCEHKKKISLFSKITNVLAKDISLILVTNIKDIYKIKKIINCCNFDCIQLHMRLNSVDLIRINKVFKDIAKRIKIISVVAMNPIEVKDDPLKLVLEYSYMSDLILLDTSWKGGSGKKHNWKLSAQAVMKAKCPCILAGGLNLDNIIDAINIVKPFGVDIQTGVEKKYYFGSNNASVKSVLKVAEIIKLLRNTGMKY